MELDELKHAWREMDRRLEASEAHSARMTRKLEFGKTRFALRSHGAVLIFELVCDVIVAVLLGSFLANEFSVAKFALPAAVLALALLASMATNLAQLVAILRIDYAAPVIAIQRQIAGIRAARIQSTQWTLLLCPLLWTPLAIVAARGLLELDVYAVLGDMVVLSNLAFGLAVIPLGIRAARMCADSLEHSPFLKRLADSVAGYSLTRAMESVNELDRFQEE